MFCSLFLLFVGLDPAQNTKGIEMHIIVSDEKIVSIADFLVKRAG